MTSTLLYLFTSLFLLYMTTPLSKNFSLPFPSPQDIRMKASEAVRDIAFLSLGMRRLGADVEFIQLMQYYGTSEEEQEHHRHDLKYGAGNYPEFFVRARHILDLDPYYRNACLYAAGVLAFNIDRPEEAVEILQQALKWDPKEWKYQTYMAAIGYQKHQQPEKVAEVLTPIAHSPDCPILVKHVIAFLNKKAGHLKEALEIYEDILATSQDPSYEKISLREIGRLRQKISGPTDQTHRRRPRR